MRLFVRSVFVSGFALALGTVPAGAQSPQEAAPVTVPPAGTPMVFLNTQALLPQVPGAREAQQTWQEEVQQYNQEVEQLRARIDSLLASYRQQESMLSPDAKQQRQQEIVQKQQELQSRASELEQKAGARQQELLKPILERVQQVIEEIRQENSYTMVFDMAGAGVVAADPALDITALVLQRLQSGDASAAASQKP
ncbi:MAG: OmpH family outer membrane protein [Gemmatimonadota bacterium]